MSALLFLLPSQKNKHTSLTQFNFPSGQRLLIPLRLAHWAIPHHQLTDVAVRAGVERILPDVDDGFAPPYVRYLTILFCFVKHETTRHPFVKNEGGEGLADVRQSSDDSFAL